MTTDEARRCKAATELAIKDLLQQLEQATRLSVVSIDLTRYQQLGRHESVAAVIINLKL